MSSDTDAFNPLKIIKLRFNTKQYNALKDACEIFKTLSENEKFIKFIKEVYGENIKEKSVQKLLIDPIIKAPLQIVVKKTTANKPSYFTNKIAIKPKVNDVIKKIKIDEIVLRYNVSTNFTCVSDIRKIISKYTETYKLKNADGIMLDKFLTTIAPETFNTYKEILIKQKNNTFLLPKENKVYISKLIKEIIS